MSATFRSGIPHHRRQVRRARSRPHRRRPGGAGDQQDCKGGQTTLRGKRSIAETEPERGSRHLSGTRPGSAEAHLLCRDGVEQLQVSGQDLRNLLQETSHEDALSAVPGVGAGESHRQRRHRAPLPAQDQPRHPGGGRRRVARPLDQRGAWAGTPRYFRPNRRAIGPHPAADPTHD